MRRRGCRAVAGQHLVHDHAEAIDVGTLVDFLAEDLLGRHVLRRANHVTGLRQLRVAAFAAAATPKSTIFSSPESLMRIFAGFRSR